MKIDAKKDLTMMLITRVLYKSVEFDEGILDRVVIYESDVPGKFKVDVYMYEIDGYDDPQPITTLLCDENTPAESMINELQKFYDSFDAREYVKREILYIPCECNRTDCQLVENEIDKYIDEYLEFKTSLQEDLTNMKKLYDACQDKKVAKKLLRKFLERDVFQELEGDIPVPDEMVSYFGTTVDTVREELTGKEFLCYETDISHEVCEIGGTMYCLRDKQKVDIESCNKTDFFILTVEEAYNYLELLKDLDQ